MNSLPQYAQTTRPSGGVAPDTVERADVFGQPQEKTDQHERQQQRHFAHMIQRPEQHAGARIQAQYQRRDVPAVITQPVMGEEVR